MRKVAVFMMVVVFLGSSAFAGIVRFDPSKQDVVIGGDMTTTFDVYIDSSEMFPDDGFTAARIVIGSNDLDLTDFVLDPTFAGFWQDAQTGPGPGVFTFDVDIQVINLFGNPIAAMGFPTLVGTLMVDATELDLGAYEVIVDSDFDNRSALANSNVGAASEGLFGMGTVNVVPEPTTLSLLGLAALGLIRRRRKSG